MNSVAICKGAFLLHADASLAACTEELEGRCCAGPDTQHLGGQVLCGEVLGPGGCEVCAGDELDDWSDSPWQHAVRVTCATRGSRLCRAHLRSYGQPLPVVDEAVLMAELAAVLRQG